MSPLRQPALNAAGSVLARPAEERPAVSWVVTAVGAPGTSSTGAVARTARKTTRNAHKGAAAPAAAALLMAGADLSPRSSARPPPSTRPFLR